MSPIAETSPAMPQHWPVYSIIISISGSSSISGSGSIFLAKMSVLLLIAVLFFCPFIINLSEKAEQRDKEGSYLNSVTKCLQHLELGEATLSWEIIPCLLSKR